MTTSPRPIRVLRVIDRLNIGGPAQHVVWLAAGLSPQAYETMLVTGSVARGEGDMSGFAAARGVTPVVIPGMSRELSVKDLLVLLRLVRLAFRFKPDIIHTHKAKAGALGRAAAWIYRWFTPSALLLRPRPCRVVHTFHGHVFHGYYGPFKSRLFVAVEHVLARVVSDRIVVVSPQQRAEIQGTFGVGRVDQFRVVPLGLELADRAAEPRVAHDPGPAGTTVIGAVGRLCRVKNFPLLLEAFARLARDDARVRLVIVGDGELRDSLETLARGLGVADRVQFTGFRSDLDTWYPRFAVTALTSVNEGTPLTLIEAMASGTAVAATAVGGVPDLMGRLVREEAGFTIWEHGVTAPSGDVETFVAALRWMLDHPDERSSMGARAARFVRERYSTRRLIADIEDLYADVLGPVSK